MIARSNRRSWPALAGLVGASPPLLGGPAGPAPALDRRLGRGARADERTAAASGPTIGLSSRVFSVKLGALTWSISALYCQATPAACERLAARPSTGSTTSAGHRSSPPPGAGIKRSRTGCSVAARRPTSWTRTAAAWSTSRRPTASSSKAPEGPVVGHGRGRPGLRRVATRGALRSVNGRGVKLYSGGPASSSAPDGPLPIRYSLIIDVSISRMRRNEVTVRRIAAMFRASSKTFFAP